MKLFGLSCGSRMDNTEVLVKEALMAAEELVAEISFLRLQELDIKPCRGCTTCVRSLYEGGDGKCVIDDDLHILDEYVMDCDGLILGSPVYTMTPSGQLKIACDRFGPSHDVGFRMEARKLAQSKGQKGPDERSFKNRVGAFISVGGGSKFVFMALPLMNLFTFPLNIKIVDQMQLVSVWYGNVLLDEGAEAVARARQLGTNVACAMGKPVDEISWMGDDAGTCPVCHSSLLVVKKNNPVVCPICGISGSIRMEGENISVHFPDEEQKRSHLTVNGMLEHKRELEANFERAKKIVRVDGEEIQRRLEKYERYGGKNE